MNASSLHISQIILTSVDSILNAASTSKWTSNIDDLLFDSLVLCGILIVYYSTDSVLHLIENIWYTLCNTSGPIHMGSARESTGMRIYHTSFYMGTSTLSSKRPAITELARRGEGGITCYIMRLHVIQQNSYKLAQCFL
jgi:hypothetical protein